MYDKITTYIGGKEINKHESDKLKSGRGAVGKTAVLGLRERKGRTVAFPVPTVDSGVLHAAIHSRVGIGSTLHTDEATAYSGIDGLFYGRETINHSAGEYVKNGVSTNSVESVWAVLKRGLHGVYHHASKKHLGRYVDEFTFRLNAGNCKIHTLDRLNSFVSATARKRLTYIIIGNVISVFQLHIKVSVLFLILSISTYN